MSRCTYTRKASCGGFEYGHIRISDLATKNESRVYVPLGITSTIDEALAANSMALKGAPRLGNNFIAPFKWTPHESDRDVQPEL